MSLRAKKAAGSKSIIVAFSKDTNVLGWLFTQVVIVIGPIGIGSGAVVSEKQRRVACWGPPEICVPERLGIAYSAHAKRVNTRAQGLGPRVRVSVREAVGRPCMDSWPTYLKVSGFAIKVGWEQRCQASPEMAFRDKMENEAAVPVDLTQGNRTMYYNKKVLVIGGS